MFFFITYKIFLGYDISTKGRLCLVEEFAFNVLVGFLGNIIKQSKKLHAPVTRLPPISRR